MDEPDAGQDWPLVDRLLGVQRLCTVPERDADVQRRLLFSPQFFRKFLSPEERTDVLMVSMEALTSASRHDVCAASKMLTMILKSSMPEIGKVAALRDLMPQVKFKILPFCSLLDLVLFYFLWGGV